jgi:cobalt-precorrin-7 (C5)-methyltransferase
MRIVGVGCGPGMLTEMAIAALREAKKCYGSDRAINLAAPFLSVKCELHPIEDYQALRDLDEDDAVVLSTGDPMFGGLGYLSGEVIPGISSLQLACARLKISWPRVVALSAHAKDHQDSLQIIREEILRGKVVFLLADPQFDIDGCAEFLRKSGISCDLAICENLGYPDERIALGSTTSSPNATSSLYSLVIGYFADTGGGQ